MRATGKPHVLIVAEDKIDAEDMAVLLSDELSCEVMTDGGPPIEAMKCDRYDLAIVDMELDRGCDPVGLLASLRELEPGMPVIMLSRKGESQAVSAGFKLGACHCLLKESRFLIRDATNVARLAIENARLNGHSAAGETL